MNPQEDLEIGQVIYCIAADTGALYPVQIAEEVVHKSIAGVKKSYTVRIDLFDENGTANPSLMSLDQLTDQWFPSLDMAKNFLIAHFTKVVDDLVEKAEQLSSLSFIAPMPAATAVAKPTAPTSQQVATGTPPQQTTQRKKPTVTLLDGTVVDLTLDEEINS